MTGRFKIDHIDHFVITVKDSIKTCEFYSEVLGMEVNTFKVIQLIAETTIIVVYDIDQNATETNF